MRLFIAVKLSKGMTKEIFRCIETLEQVKSDTKWVKPENIHLTLKFLGETPDELEPVVAGIMAKTAAVFPVFEFGLEKLGGFPSAWAPKMIWAGIKGGSGYLIKLAGNMDDALAAVGFKREERGFNPHITLGKVKSGKNMLALRDAIQSYSFLEAKQTVTSVHLIKSDLTDEGPIYKDLAEAKLS